MKKVVDGQNHIAILWDENNPGEFCIGDESWARIVSIPVIINALRGVGYRVERAEKEA